MLSDRLCDYCATYFARRNGGVFEPEFRLVLIIPMLSKLGAARLRPRI